jgi:type I restriction enzyme S subunit
MKGWERVGLGEVLSKTVRVELVEPTKEYRLLGVRLEGRGPFIRETVLGTQTSAAKLFRVEAGDFIYSRLFACRGAFGVIDESMAGCFVSGEFPIFQPLEDRIDVQFLRYWFTLPSVIARVDEDCSGSTPLTRNRFKENFFLALEIPLPPLAEQRRIVARIESLAAQIDVAKRLRQEAVEEGVDFLVSMAHRSDLSDQEKQASGWRRTRLADVVRLVDDLVLVEPEKSYPNIGIYCFGRGLFRKEEINGLATSASKLRRLSNGQFIYSRLFAFEGAYGMVTEEFDGSFVSQEYPTFQCDQSCCLPEFLVAHFKPETIWKSVAAGSKDLGDRRQRVQPPQVLQHELWVPSLAWQERIAQVTAEVNGLKRLQAETAAELGALLPAILDRAFKGEL